VGALGDELGADDRDVAGCLDPEPHLTPSSRTTVTQMSSPMKSLSISFLVNTSTAHGPFLDAALRLRSSVDPRAAGQARTPGIEVTASLTGSSAGTGAGAEPLRR
jgi:hypothetical protein